MMSSIASKKEKEEKSNNLLNDLHGHYSLLSQACENDEAAEGQQWYDATQALLKRIEEEHLDFIKSDDASEDLKERYERCKDFAQEYCQQWNQLTATAVSKGGQNSSQLFVNTSEARVKATRPLVR